MGKSYLIDTNAVIDFLDDKLPENASELIASNTPHISVITRMELLGWSYAIDEQLKIIQLFIKASQEYNLNESVILKVIDLRKTHKIKLPDAIIAATSIVFNHTLVTRNTDDFKHIEELTLLNPYDLQVRK